MSDLSKTDWVSIHAKAWKDPKFRDLLERDPTAAVKKWAKEYRRTVSRIIDLTEWVKVDIDDWNNGPPSCC
jgi:hypothetical protein